MTSSASPTATPAAKKRRKAAKVQPLLLTTRQAAALCALSKATFNRMLAAGLTPRPVRPSPGCVRHRRADLELWVAWGCPSRAEFEARLKAIR